MGKNIFCGNFNLDISVVQDTKIIKKKIPIYRGEDLKEKEQNTIVEKLMSKVKKENAIKYK